MDNNQIIQAWKDTDYRRSLSEKEISSLPEHPTGWEILDDFQLGEIFGGNGEGEMEASWVIGTLGCCTGKDNCGYSNGICSYTFYTLGCCH